MNSVSQADGVEVTELEPLYDYIDPEVLSVLEHKSRGDWSFTFQYVDHQITVTHRSRVFIDGVQYSPNSDRGTRF